VTPSQLPGNDRLDRSHACFSQLFSNADAACATYSVSDDVTIVTMDQVNLFYLLASLSPFFLFERNHRHHRHNQSNCPKNQRIGR
jgi:hypothetical protein